MSYCSVLFRTPADQPEELREAPACFRDLHLDRIVDEVTAGWKAYDLAPFFHAPLHDVDAVTYRQEVSRDLERDDVTNTILGFADAMRAVRERGRRASAASYSVRERQRSHLRSAELYCDAVEQLARDLARLAPSSRGLRGFAEWLAAYLGSAGFTALATAARTAAADLGSARYTLWIRSGGAVVRPHEDADDYAAQIEETFAKFRRGETRDYLAKLASPEWLSDLELRILDGVAELYPAAFQALEAFATEHAAFVDDAIARFDREIEVYVAYLARITPLRRAGLAFCYPELSSSSKEASAKATFDLALAAKLHVAQAPIVYNDFVLRGAERVFVVTGPNQGGKTTFARMFGQLHYLAALGLPVPGTEVRLAAFDHLFTHFERAEHVESLQSKLEDDLVRMHEILANATSRSILIVNEAFASTTADDAAAISKRVMARMSDLDLMGVWVTFLDELAAFDAKTVSVVGGVDATDPTVRTFRIDRAPASGLAYAFALAEKYSLTYARLVERVRP